MTSARWRVVVATVLACIGADTAFGALYQGWGWLLPTVGAVIVIVAVSEAVRRSRLPSAFGPLLAAVAIGLYVTALDASSTAVAGFLPGGSARHALVTQLRGGAQVVHHYAAPVPDRRGAVLLALIGIAAMTLVVDLFALTLDRAVLAGPPLLAPYVVAALNTHHGVGWLPFVLATAGFLSLLAAETDASRTRWGRRLGADDGRLGVPGGMGQRLGAGAIAIAVLVPVAIPRLHTDLTSGGPGSTSNNNVVTLNPLVSIDADLHGANGVQVLSYTTNAPDPGYLRLTALDAFNGVTFSAVELRSATSTPVTAGAALDGAPGTAGHDEVSTQIAVDGLDAHWAPIPQNTVSAQIGNGWLFDPGTDTVWSSSGNTVGLSLATVSNPHTPRAAALRSITYADLAAAGRPLIDLAVPASIPPSVVRLAHSLRRSTPYATALAIQDHFLSGQFTYDLSVPSTASAAALTTFLFHTHAGFCQQFSASMAVLARIDGIPARIAVGFTRGTPEGNGTWVVTGSDAHAWPELDFPGDGWLPFEPTPRADGQVALPAYAVGPVGPGSGNNDFRRHKTGNGSSRHGATGGGSKRSPRPKPVAAAVAHHSGSSPAGPISLAVLLIALLAFAVPATWRLVGRRHHAHAVPGAQAAHAAWDEVRDTVLDLGGEWPDGHSPARSVDLLMREVPDLVAVSAALRRIAVAEQQARYARTVTVDVGHRLREDVRAVRQILLDRAGRAGRLRAMVLPRSTMAAMRRSSADRRKARAGAQRSKRRWNRSSSRTRIDRRGPAGRAPVRRGSRIQR